MSKLSFRARALDAIKPMPVYYMEEVPDLPDFAAINRAVPQMPTGMEKEEECEHHLQRAMSAQQAYGHTGELVIPTPEVYEVPKEFLQKLYPTTYKHPRQLIHVQPFSMEQDIPDYDMDSEDEKWFSAQAAKMDITPLQFELMMDRLEKSSSQQVITLKEAKVLLKEDDDLLIAVYDYWLMKRLKTTHPLIPQVKSEKRDGSTNNNPYVAFRRRTEKMQTRKNRKNDETSYEKMLKLKRDLMRASSLLEMVRKREKIKREHLHLSVEIFEKRYMAGDFSGQLLSEMLKLPRPPVAPTQKSIIVIKPEAKLPKKPIKQSSQRKRPYKRKSKSETSAGQSVHRTGLGYADAASSDEDTSMVMSDQEDDNDPDGPFAFKRKKNCNYYAPREQLGNWPWCSKEDNGTADKLYRYCLTSIPTYDEPRCVGFARRRIGRGGRVLFDRAYTPLDDCWDELDGLVTTSLPNGLPNTNDLLREIKTEWKWFRPKPCTSSSSSSRHDFDPNSSEFDSLRWRNSLGDSRLSMTTQMPMDIHNRNSQCSSQEELFEMQRKQLERLKTAETSNNESCLLSASTSHGADHSFLSQPTSRFTLNQCRMQLSTLSPVINDFAAIVSDEASSSSSSPLSIPSSCSSLVAQQIIQQPVVHVVQQQQPQQVVQVQQPQQSVVHVVQQQQPVVQQQQPPVVQQQQQQVVQQQQHIVQQPSHVVQQVVLTSDSNSITSGILDRIALTNGPIAERSDGAVGSGTIILRSSGKDFVLGDALSNADFSQAVLHSMNICLTAGVPSTTDRGEGNAGSRQSTDNIHVIPTKAFTSSVPSTELRFMGIEQNGREVKLKPESFLKKVKVEKVNDSGVSMDVT